VVAVLLPNGREFIEVLLAVQQAGWHMVPVNFHLVGPEIAYIVEDSGAKAFIAHERFAAEAVRAGSEMSLPESARFAVGSIEGYRPYVELTVGQPTSAPDDRKAGALMNYTSGTTGRPKRVKRPLPDLDPDTMAEFGTFLHMLFGIEPHGDNVHITVAPLYHTAVAQFTINALHSGHGVVLMDRWTPEGTLERIQRYRVTTSHMVPTMFHRMLQLPDDVRASYDVSSLRHVIEVDQEVSAADEIEARKRRVVRHILPREDAQVADLLHDAEVVVVLLEEPFTALTRDIPQGIGVVDARPSPLERRLADIGAENLHLGGQDAIADPLQELDRDRVHLFAGRATRYPDPDRLSRVPSFAQCREDLTTQHVEGSRVAKEFRDPDEKVLVERGRLPRVTFDPLGVFREALDSLQRHASIEASPQRAAFVVCEVHAMRGAESLKDPLEEHLLFGGDGSGCSVRRGLPAQSHELTGNFLRTQHPIDKSRFDGVAGHVAKPCGIGILGEDDTAFVFYRLYPEGAVGVAAREYYSNCVPGIVDSE